MIALVLAAVFVADVPPLLPRVSRFELVQLFAPAALLLASRKGVVVQRIALTQVDGSDGSAATSRARSGSTSTTSRSSSGSSRSSGATTTSARGWCSRATATSS